MKSNKIASIALLLWIVTIAVFAWFFIRGNTTAGTDNRMAVVLPAAERNLILTEMRGMLASTQAILEAANQGDARRVALAARASGMAAAADVNPALMARLPLEFKSLGLSVHRDMDEIAKAAEVGTASPEIVKMVSNALLKCVACHAAWQLKVQE